MAEEQEQEEEKPKNEKEEKEDKKEKKKEVKKVYFGYEDEKAAEPLDPMVCCVMKSIHFTLLYLTTALHC